MIISIFSTVQIWRLREIFFCSLLLIFLSVDPNILIDTDPGSPNVVDPTDPDPKHWVSIFDRVRKKE